MSLKLASLTEADVSLPVLPGVAVGILDEGSLEVPDGQGTSEVSVLPQRDTALPIRLLLGVQGTAAPYKVLCGGGCLRLSPCKGMLHPPLLDLFKSNKGHHREGLSIQSESHPSHLESWAQPSWRDQLQWDQGPAALTSACGKTSPKGTVSAPGSCSFSSLSATCILDSLGVSHLMSQRAQNNRITEHPGLQPSPVTTHFRPRSSPPGR